MTAAQVAVKIQYPGAAAALKADMDQLSRMAPLLGMLVPGVEMRPLMAELRARVMEELDYAAEADNQRAFAGSSTATRTSPIPRIVASAPKVIVSEWVDGIGLAEIIARGTPAQRNRAGRVPGRVALLGAAARRPAARRPAPGELQDHRRRPARRGGLRLGGAAAGRHAADHRAGVTACPRGRRRRGACRAASPPASSARSSCRIPRRCSTTWRPSWNRCGTGRSTSPGPGCNPRQRKMSDLSSAESKLARHLNLPAVVSDDPPGDLRVDRRAMPVGRGGPVPGDRRTLATRIHRRRLTVCSLVTTSVDPTWPRWSAGSPWRTHHRS